MREIRRCALQSGRPCQWYTGHGRGGGYGRTPCPSLARWAAVTHYLRHNYQTGADAARSRRSMYCDAHAALWARLHDIPLPDEATT